MIRATGQGRTKAAATAAALNDLEAQYDGRVPVRVWTAEEMPMFTRGRASPVGWIVSVAGAFSSQVAGARSDADRGPEVDTRPVDEQSGGGPVTLGR